MHVIGFRCLCRSDVLVAAIALHTQSLQHIGEDHYVHTFAILQKGTGEGTECKDFSIGRTLDQCRFSGSWSSLVSNGSSIYNYAVLPSLNYLLGLPGRESSDSLLA